MCSDSMAIAAGAPAPPRIVAFTKDWDDVPTCTTHILRRMGRHMPVLWIESIGTRRPNLAAAKDLTRIWRRLRRAWRRAELKENKLRVLSPFVIPRAGSAFGRRVNRSLMNRQIARELRDMGSGRVEYWCFVPGAVDFLPGKAGTVNGDSLTVNGGPPSLVIYYCVDDWSKFTYLDADWTARKERELLERADVVFASSRYLQDRFAELGVKARYMPHGADVAEFSRAASEEAGVPSDVATLPRPLVGFYGNLHAWVDLGLVRAIAGKLPQWSFVLIGQAYADVSPVADLPNVHLLGRREHRELPSYCRAFDAAMIPYDMRDPRMLSVNPVKTYELLAAGVPIVSAPLPEYERMSPPSPDIVLCRSVNEWVAALKQQAARRDRRAIAQRAATHDWEARVKQIREVVEGAAASASRRA